MVIGEEMEDPSNMLFLVIFKGDSGDYSRGGGGGRVVVMSLVIRASTMVA